MRGILGVLCGCVILLGCGSNRGPSPQVSETAPAPLQAPAPPPSPPPPPPPSPQADVSAAGEQSAPAEVEPEGPASVESESEPARGRRAEVGVGRKGHGYGTGPVATPLATRWRAAERLIFNVQIPQAMNLFKATHGRAPASHDEFMKEIINANQIRLPELRHGERYYYDPAAEQLMVVDAEGP